MKTRLLALASAAALAGCGTEFAPESYLDGLRILALSPDPAEVGPGEAVTLRPTVYALASDPVTSTRWSFCPLSLGSTAGYACAVPSCETPLTAAADGSVTADPSALALACLQSQPVPPPGSGSGEVPAVLETVFRLRVTSASGEVRDAVGRVPLHTASLPVDRNLAPVVTAVELDGVPAIAGAVGATIPAGGSVRLTVRVDPASVQTYLDANGRSVQETVVVFFYASAGRLDDERGEAPVAETALVANELLAGQTEALVYAVVRDLRGGEAVAGPFRVAIGP